MNIIPAVCHRFAATACIMGLFTALVACGGSGGGRSPLPPPPPNTAPTASAGGDQTAAENEVVRLAGSGADADGDTLSYAWSQVSGPAGSFSAGDAASTEFSVPTIAVGATEEIVLRLTVSDGRGGSATDELTVSASSSDFLVFRRRADETSPLELVRYDPQTGNESVLNAALVANGQVEFFAVSPDRQSIAYIADQETEDRFELYVVALDGSGVVKINAPFANAAGDVKRMQWSPDSSQLAYDADAELDEITEIYLADSDGSNHRKISADTGNGSFMVSLPTWSPDGRYVLQYVQSPLRSFIAVDVYDTQAGNSGSTRITAPDTNTLREVRWSPDSSHVAYSANLEVFGANDLYTVAPDGSGLLKVSGPQLAAGGVNRFAWAPDGTRLAYWGEQNVDDQDDLFVVAPDGSGLTQVNGPLPADRDIIRAVWSPDSAQLAYMADDIEDNVFRLFTAAADGSNAQPVSLSPDGTGNAFAFRWAPDGQRLAYLGFVDDVATHGVFAVNGDGTDAAMLNDPIAPMGRASFAISTDFFSPWSPDGTMFAYSITTVANGDYDLFIAAADGSNNVRVLHPPTANAKLPALPAWSADSTALVYLSSPQTSGPAGLYLASADGTDNVLLADSAAESGPVSSLFTWVN